MSHTKATRREFLRKSALLAAAGMAAPHCFFFNNPARAEGKNDRLTVAAIGVGGRGSGIARQAAQLGTMAAGCDVDSNRAGKFASGFEHKVETCSDYRKILDRKDVDVVTVGTPDHWHTKISIDALKAGKDVYCEKPLTLTIDEGKLISKVVKETGRVFQVGTQQRSENAHRFLKAVVIARSGRLGKKLTATSAVGRGRSGGPFKEEKPPAHLDWDMWLGQAPMTPYIKERTHYQFRWWLEYSGGQITDWGVHHTDIALWALGLENSGPTTIQGKGKFNKGKNCYNAASEFDCRMDFEGGHRIHLTSGRNMLTIEGDKGRIEVNRGTLRGKPVEEIAESKSDRERLEEEVKKLYRGMRMGGHMQNFFDCVRDRALPISDVFTHHRSVSACHLANLAMRLGRKLKWDPKKEDFIGDKEASSMLRREQRAPYQNASSPFRSFFPPAAKP